MTPDEARKGCGECYWRTQGCEYHNGYQDGYEAAQRERGPIEAVGKPLPRSANYEGRPGR